MRRDEPRGVRAAGCVDPRVGVLQGPRAAVGTESRRLGGVGEQGAEDIAERTRVGGRHVPSCVPSTTVSHCPFVRGDDRLGHRHAFEDGRDAGLEVVLDERHDDEVGIRVELA